MARVKRGKTSHARHKKVLELAKGARGTAKNCFRTAIQRAEKSLQYAYRDRRAKKREIRALWIVRINAAVREQGLTYARFMNGLKCLGIELDRKQLSELAIHEPTAFKSLVDQAKVALDKKAA